MLNRLDNIVESIKRVSSLAFVLDDNTITVCWLPLYRCNAFSLISHRSVVLDTYAKGLSWVGPCGQVSRSGLCLTIFRTTHRDPRVRVAEPIQRSHDAMHASTLYVLSEIRIYI